MIYTQATHDSRQIPQGVRSPQTSVQVEQVRRILAADKPGERALTYRWPTETLLAEAAGAAGYPTTIQREHEDRKRITIGSTCMNVSSKENQFDLKAVTKGKAVINIAARAGPGDDDDVPEQAWSVVSPSTLC
jgi:hypothetical protein